MVKRTDRLKEQLRKEISLIIQREIKDPRMGMVTITGIEVSNDLRNVKALVSIFGDKENTIKILNQSIGFIRHKIGQKIRIKYIPELIFKIDDSWEKQESINKILQQIKNENKN